MLLQVVTLFPEMFSGVVSTSILKRAQTRAGVEIRIVGLRDFGVGVHRTTDDYPFGGGPGMLLRADVVVPAVEWAVMHHAEPPRILWTSPGGRRLDQGFCRELAGERHLLMVAGHYEGIDERARLLLGGEEVSIGDYVLTGGELAAMVIMDAVVRLLPGVLGDAGSPEEDSFSLPGGLLEGPQYTRPEVYRGFSVPPVLISGDHGRIRAWRREQALSRTRAVRPDLLDRLDPDPEA